MGRQTTKAESVRIVVCDTGPILHLSEAKLLDWLSTLGTVFVPPAVDDELSSLVRGWRESRPGWMVLQPPAGALSEPVASVCNQSNLGPGETEAIALALERHADWLLTDDTMARVVAEMAGLEVHGSLGVVLFRAAQREVGYDEARSALDRLASSSLWLSQRILTKAQTTLKSMFQRP